MSNIFAHQKEEKMNIYNFRHFTKTPFRKVASAKAYEYSISHIPHYNL